MKKVILFLTIFVVLVLTACSHTHTLSNELIIVKEPSCVAEGEGHLLCEECGEIAYIVSIPSNNLHQEVLIPETKATCSQIGLTEGSKCSLCNQVLVEQVEIPTLEHTYSNAQCLECGTEHPNLANYKGKVISILGDSISTFDGYIPTADGFNLEHVPRYPQDNLLTDVNETWWMQVITKLDAKLGINESWRSTEIGNVFDVEVNSGYEGTKACMASLTRIQNLGSNGTPDVILFYGGTNDILQRRTIGTFDPETAPTTVDLTTTTWDTVAEAYVAAIMRMQYYYPEAHIIAMLPTYTSQNTNSVLETYNSVFAEICEHYGIKYIDLRYCGISTSNLPDGIHPDAKGMDYISDMAFEMLVNSCEINQGENIVYSVTHNLLYANSSLSYYKGVSQGRPFVTTASGDNIEVNVIMDGIDITASSYDNGIINIDNVAGDIIIQIIGEEKSIFADSLQQLPQNVCSSLNLWKILTPENRYYTASGWGNLSSGQVWSITIPVSSGDKIFSTSFKIAGENGNSSFSSNGIRVTYFDENGVLKALTPAQTYSEFVANGGYLLVPEGAVAVNIPMWNESVENAVYILNRTHIFQNDVCIGCGMEK